MSLESKKIKLSKKELEKLAEALKNRKSKKINKKTEKQILSNEDKFIESGINLEKISPVLKPVAKQRERLEQVASSFALQKKSEDKSSEKPYEFGEQKYFSKSGEYKTIEKIQTENTLIQSEFDTGISHMGVKQATTRKSERFFEEKQEQKYSAELKTLEEIKKKDKEKFYVPR